MTSGACDFLFCSEKCYTLCDCPNGKILLYTSRLKENGHGRTQYAFDQSEHHQGIIGYCRFQQSRASDFPRTRRRYGHQPDKIDAGSGRNWRLSALRRIHERNAGLHRLAGYRRLEMGRRIFRRTQNCRTTLYHRDDFADQSASRYFHRCT